MKVTFNYLPDGRRIRKEVFRRQGGVYVSERVHQFRYDSMNLVKERITEAGGAVTVREFIYGLDLAGMRSGRGLEGAGGIGGVVFVKETKNAQTKTYIPVYNQVGTVTQLIDADTGLVAAFYQYTNFGVPLVATGPAKDACPLRFTSKYYDEEIGVYFLGAIIISREELL